MKARYIPVIVTTKEALDVSLAAKACVIYVCRKLYLSDPEAIDHSLEMQGYQKTHKQGRKGIFFVRPGGENGFDETTCEL